MFPADHHQIKTTISYENMAVFLKSAESTGFITASEEGRSTEGRSLFLVHLCHSPAARFRILFYAQQHGDEISGKDAQLYLIRSIAENPALLPEDVDLFLLPMVNPDGAESNQRANGAKADLNRDHILLTQPETQTLYRVARRVMPHLTADCHEFTRDGENYIERGWEAWPLITMDALNHPLIPGYLKEAGLEIVQSVEPIMKRAGHAYRRYTVGGPPPDKEIRPSTPEVDDGRNGLGSQGALSFIIEAGVKRHTPDPEADLGARVDAYLILFKHLIGTCAFRSRILDLVESARREPLPPFIATNCFWANLGGRVDQVKVVERSTGKILEIPTPNFMTDLVVKSSVPMPKAYAIEARFAARFKPLLENHGLHFEELKAPRRFLAESCRLLRVEEPFDEVYQRYENRQIVARDPASDREFPQGALLVSLEQSLARRAVEVLEPCLLYGLYSYPEFKSLAGPQGILPVWRVIMEAGLKR